MIQIEDKKDCCGCSACAEACPKACILMEADTEGFLYPNVDTSVCIDCHLCEKVCPILNVEPDQEKPQDGYIVQHKNRKVLRESTSGGAFTAIAEWMIEQKGGIVFGAAYDDDFVVRHTWVDKKEQLFLFRNSKYTQSNIGETYKEARNFLIQGKWVLFSGTPCQLEGLLRFLRKPYERLLTVDVVCRACPSPLVFKKYIEMQKEEIGDGFDTVLFRDKYYGYQYSAMSIKANDKYIYHEGIDTDPYLRAFFSAISIRPSCTSCAFRKRYRDTDLTIWDCFDIAEYSKEMNNERGATKVLAHTEKGRNLMKCLNESLIMMNAKPKQMLKMGRVNEIDITLTAHPLREQFFEDLNLLPPKELFNKYFPIKVKNRLEKTVRIITFKLGAYALIKRVYVALVGRDNIKR